MPQERKCESAPLKDYNALTVKLFLDVSLHYRIWVKARLLDFPSMLSGWATNSMKLRQV